MKKTKTKRKWIVFFVFLLTEFVVFSGVVHPVHDFDDALAEDLDATGSAEGLQSGRRVVVVVVLVIVAVGRGEVCAATENHRVQNSVPVQSKKAI